VHDQQERIASLAPLADSDSVFATPALGGRAHIEMRSRHKATPIVAIWARARRNPTTVRTLRAVDANIRTQLQRVIEIAKQSGEASPSVNTVSVGRYIFTYVGKLLKRSAVKPGVDAGAEAEADHAFNLLKTLSKCTFAPVGTECSR
jgi:hypothetical protein